MLAPPKLAVGLGREWGEPMGQHIGVIFWGGGGGKT